MRNAFILRALPLLCAYLIGGAGAAAAAPDGVKLGVTSVYPSNAVFYAAKELGYYQAANLEVDIQTFRGGPAALDALAAGTIDVTVAVPASAAQQKSGNVRIVAMFAPSRPAGWYIMVPASSPVTTLAALNGKTVGVTQLGSVSDEWVQAIAARANIKLTSVALAGSVDAGLRAKQVDAAIEWPLASYKGLTTGDLRAVADVEASARPAVVDGIAVAQSTIDKRSEVLKRWLAATAKAVDYMKSHDDWTLKFLKRYFDEDDDAAVALVYKNYIMKMNPAGSMRADWEQNSLESLGAGCYRAESGERVRADVHAGEAPLGKMPETLPVSAPVGARYQVGRASHPAVDGERGAGDPARGVRQQKQYRVTDVVGAAERAQRTRCQPPIDAVGPCFRQARAIDQARRYPVHAHVVRTEFQCGRSRMA